MEKRGCLEASGTETSWSEHHWIFPGHRRLGCATAQKLVNPRVYLPGSPYYLNDASVPVGSTRGGTRLTISTTTAQERAEASFKKKEKQLAEGQKARAEYEVSALAVREKTARLKALRLAHEARQGRQDLPPGQNSPPETASAPLKRKGRPPGSALHKIGTLRRPT